MRDWKGHRIRPIRTLRERITKILEYSTLEDLFGSKDVTLNEQLGLIAFCIDMEGNILPLTPGVYSSFLSKSFKDTSFIATDSPVTLDINTALGRNSRDGYIVCDGEGNIDIEYTNDGTNWSDKDTLKKNEVYSLEKLDIKKIRIIHTGTDSAYRVMVI